MTRWYGHDLHSNRFFCVSAGVGAEAAGVREMVRRLAQCGQTAWLGIGWISGRGSIYIVAF
jgi:hypothetical protein